MGKKSGQIQVLEFIEFEFDFRNKSETKLGFSQRSGLSPVKFVQTSVDEAQILLKSGLDRFDETSVESVDQVGVSFSFVDDVLLQTLDLG